MTRAPDQLVVSAFEPGWADGEVEFAVPGLQVEHAMPSQGLPRGAERQSFGDGVGADARVELPQRSGQPVQVLAGGRRGDVDVAGGPHRPVHPGGVAADDHVRDAVAFEHRQDRLGVEHLWLGRVACALWLGRVACVGYRWEARLASARAIIASCRASVAARCSGGRAA